MDLGDAMMTAGQLEAKARREKRAAEIVAHGHSPDWCVTHNYPWSAPDKGPFVDPDTGIDHGSRAQLQKQVRIRTSKLAARPKNADRIKKALRSIIRDSGGDVSRMMLDEIRTVARATATAGTTNQDAAIEQIIREEVGKALGFTPGYGADKRVRGAKEFKEWVKKIALDETKRLVLEHLSFDVKVSGDVFVPARGIRAINLDE